LRPGKPRFGGGDLSAAALKGGLLKAEELQLQVALEAGGVQ
jgi:hypothetical protein